MNRFIEDVRYWLYKKKYSLLKYLAKEQINDALTNQEMELWRIHQEELEMAYNKGFVDGQKQFD